MQISDSRPVGCSALMVAAPASGQGKTLVTAALARLLSRQGRAVRVFKCGPDFLDPHWHALASGAQVHTLDGWMAGSSDAAARLHAAAREADCIVIEAVMGLFDGQPSAAELAMRWDIPVLCVLQAGAMVQTCAAIAHGLRTYRSGLRWAGVLCNGVASAHHGRMLQEALGDAQWLGGLPRLPAGLPQRHLGLIPADEIPDALARLDAAADALASTPLGLMDAQAWQARWQVMFAPPPAPPAPLGQSLSAGSPSTADPITPAAPAAPASVVSAASAGLEDEARDAARWQAAQRIIACQPLRGRTVAIARDAAFAFIYPANVQCLQAMGARVVFFSPLAGDALPACDALWLPGGYPELYAPQLAAQHGLRQALAEHMAQGKPIWAECGGMLAVCEQLVDADGHAQALWALMPGQARMHKRLMGLGPQQWDWAQAWMAQSPQSPPLLQSPVATVATAAAALAPLRGHTFHYSTLESTAPVLAQGEHPAHRSSSARPAECIYQWGSLRASYLHGWFASSPLGVAWLLGAPDALLHDAAQAAQVPA